MTDEDASNWAKAHMENLRCELEDNEADSDHVKDWQVELLERKIAEQIDEVSSKLDNVSDTIHSHVAGLRSDLSLIGLAVLILLGLILWRVW